MRAKRCCVDHYMFHSTNLSLPLMPDMNQRHGMATLVAGNRLHLLMLPDSYVLVVSMMSADSARVD